MGTFKKAMGTICANCPLCNHARNKPDTALGKVMEWHGKWCPSWKAYAEMEMEKRAREQSSSSAVRTG
jgi:CxxC motif-containing protein